MTDSAQAAIYTPTLRERFWRRLGFRYHLGETPQDADLLEGWMQTSAWMNFDLADRLRLLVTGKLRIKITSHMDCPSPSVIKNRLDWRIIEPGAKE